MTTLDERFDEARRIPAPELGAEVERRRANPTTPPEHDPGGPSPRQRLLAGAVAALVFLAAGAFFLLSTRNPGTGPATTTDASDVLMVRCDAHSIEVSTPVVVAQPDGLHVRASVSGMTDPEVSVRSTGEPNGTYLSGSDGAGSEFVRPLPPGEATVHCESGPQQMDGPEQLSATFSFVDPNGVFTDARPDCPDVATLGPTEDPKLQQGQPLSAADIVRTRVTGIQPTDVVEPAGYTQGTWSTSIIRVTRDGQVIGSFRVSDAGATWSMIDDGHVCSSSGLAYR
ncbi:MAG: hypothetical protein ABJA81_02795 [Nocardioidaceae bacterium]